MPKMLKRWQRNLPRGERGLEVDNDGGHDASEVVPMLAPRVAGACPRG